MYRWKSKGNWQQVSRSIEHNLPVERKLQKINRYYISNNGCKIIKVNKTDGREIQLESGRWMQTIMNNIEHKSGKTMTLMKHTI